MWFGVAGARRARRWAHHLSQLAAGAGGAAGAGVPLGALSFAVEGALVSVGELVAVDSVVDELAPGA
ncbi:MAG: hypothetical protein ABSB60_06025 [Terracidiphilus sp.]|jgi:hypothetical protein